MCIRDRSSCNRGCSSPCQSVNYWKNAQLCQQFYYAPCSYEVQQDCVNYQVTATEFWSFELDAWNSSFHIGFYCKRIRPKSNLLVPTDFKTFSGRLNCVNRFLCPEAFCIRVCLSVSESASPRIPKTLWVPYIKKQRRKFHLILVITVFAVSYTHLTLPTILRV